MFYQIRYQTGEIEDMVAEMKKATSRAWMLTIWMNSTGW